MKKRESFYEKALNQYAEKHESEGKSTLMLDGTSPPLIIFHPIENSSPIIEVVYTYKRSFSAKGEPDANPRKRLAADFDKGATLVTIIDVHPTKGIRKIKSYKKKDFRK